MSGENKNPLVSVILPNYNHASFLKQRIDSVLNQTFQDFELILLDDASTDDSLEILFTYENNPKVSHVIINDKNSGSPFLQWRKGIDLAVGAYIWIAESDDFAESRFLEQTVFRLTEDQKSNLVYVDSKIVNEKGETLGFWRSSKNKRFKTTKWSANYNISGFKETTHYLLFNTTINNASAVLFRKKAISSSGFLEKLVKFRTAGDLFTYIFVAFNSEISYISSPLNNYREHTLNTTKKNTKSGLLYIERLLCFEQVLDLVMQYNPSSQELFQLKKAYKHIIGKNGFKLIDYGFQNDLNRLIDKASSVQIFSRFEGVTYIVLFKMYGSRLIVLKKIAKKILRNIL